MVSITSRMHCRSPAASRLARVRPSSANVRARRGAPAMVRACVRRAGADCGRNGLGVAVCVCGKACESVSLMSDDGKTRPATLGASIENTLLCTSGMCLWFVGCEKQGRMNQLSHTEAFEERKNATAGGTGGTLAAASTKAKPLLSEHVSDACANAKEVFFLCFHLSPNSSSWLFYLSTQMQARTGHKSSLPLHACTHTGRGLLSSISSPPGWLIHKTIKINDSASPLLPAVAVAAAPAPVAVVVIHSLSQSH